MARLTATPPGYKTPAAAALHELGASTPAETISELVEQVRAFDPELSTPDENMMLARALKLIAADTLRRHDAAVALETQMRERLATASVCAELSDVIDIIRPAKRPWWRR